MIDSCSARKLEPGLAQMYSNPSDFSTSTMKSEPGRSAVNTSAAADTGSVSLANAAAEGTAVPRPGCVSCALAGVFATSTAAPAAALFRKPRRPEGFSPRGALDFDMQSPVDFRLNYAVAAPSERSFTAHATII